MLRNTVVQSLIFVLLAWTNHSTTLATETSQPWRFTDIEGIVHEPFDDASIRAIALIFISTDCPIANSYQPLLRRLADTYSKQGIAFYMVHPSEQLTVDEARKHAKDFGISSPVVIDAKSAIARRVGATVTPEVFVYARDRESPLYQGRIDDWYAGYGKKRNVATAHEFADALDALVNGRAVEVAATKPVGCIIYYPKRAVNNDDSP